MSTPGMQRAKLDRLELEYYSQGAGEPVVFIHGAMAGAFSPMFNDPSLYAYQLISYNRRGFGGSTHSTSATIQEHAEDCSQFLNYLEIEKAHLVGHSSGALVALQHALDYPDQVHSLSLLETGLPSLLLAASDVKEGIQKAMPLYQAGDKVGAFDAFMRAFVLPDYGEVVGRVFGSGAFEQALSAIDTLFQVEFPALQAYSFLPADAAQIKLPVLLVLGQTSLPYWRKIHQEMQSLLPHAESYELPQADHLLMVRNPGEMAQALSQFLGRHPLAGQAV